VSPSQGRILIYVWAIEQDEQSRRNIPTEPQLENTSGVASEVGPGRDVFVPWVLSKENTNKNKPKAKTKSKASQDGPNAGSAEAPQVFNRYYHMFAEGELAELVRNAAYDLGLHVGPVAAETVDKGVGTETRSRGLEIVQDGWERSNYYVELRCWEN